MLMKTGSHGAGLPGPPGDSQGQVRTPRPCQQVSGEGRAGPGYLG